MADLYKREAEQLVRRIWKDPTDLIEQALNDAVEVWRARLLIAMAKAGHKDACDFVMSWNGDLKEKG